MLCFPLTKCCVGPEKEREPEMHPARKGAMAVDFLVSIAVLATAILSMTVAPFPITLSPAAQLAVAVGGGVMLLSTALNSLVEAGEQKTKMSNYLFGSNY